MSQALHDRMRQRMQREVDQLSKELEAKRALLAEFNRLYPPDQTETETRKRGGLLKVDAAIDRVLAAAESPMSRSEIVTGIASTPGLRRLPKESTVRSVLSRDREEKGWMMTGAGKTARWYKKGTKADPDFGIDATFIVNDEGKDDDDVPF